MATVLLLGLGPASSGPCDPEIFRVVRNTNANAVVYEARLSPGGDLDPGDPVQATWVMLAEDGRREGLTWLERAMAYGVDTHAVDPGHGAVVALRARPELEIRVELVAGCPLARTRIAGSDAVLRTIAVEASGGPFPQVRWVDLVGVDPAGHEVRERQYPVEGPPTGPP